WPDSIETDAGGKRSPGPRERLETPVTNPTKNRGGRRTPPAPAISFDRRKALEALREHLKVIAFHCPGFWIRANLIPDGVEIRMSHKVNGFEETMAVTRQSDKLLMAVKRPDFFGRLVDELIHQGFPLEKDQINK